MTAYAIIETGGKQLRVEPGRFYDVERMAVEPDDQITIDKVLFIQNDGEVSIGQPFVTGAVVQATVLRHLRGRKVIVYKMRPKKKTRKKQGHRQELTRLMITGIDLNGSTIGNGQSTVQPAQPVAAEVATATVEPEVDEDNVVAVEPEAEPEAVQSVTATEE